jgi:hypothetical protein
MSDPFGRALLDFHHGEQSEPLIQFDGEKRREHPVEQFYFEPFSNDGVGGWLDRQLTGPLLDVGAGAGRDALHFQEAFGTVALEVSSNLVTLLRERGVADVRNGDMFAVSEQFDADRFESVLLRGTQFGLAKSMQTAETLLNDLARVTTPTATAVVDGYDPTDERASSLLGYRADDTPGLAFRVMTFEYEGTVGETLLFRLFSPEKLREAAAETPWTVASVKSAESSYYAVQLRKA